MQRLKEEYQSLIQYVENNKKAGNDWFRLESNKEGTWWFGKCWYIHDLLKYEFDIEFDVSVLEWEIEKLVEGEFIFLERTKGHFKWEGKAEV